MIQIKDKVNCCGCTACVNSCPANCIQMREDEEGFLYPIVDEDICIQCGICTRSCPFQSENKKEYEKTALAVKAYDDDIRMNSSSGGVFSLLATKIIEQGGIVFGAALSEDSYSLSHIMIGDILALERLRGSKYFQSNMGESYKIVKQYLEKGKKVLFSGTPCQIAGLNSFLKRDYGNLFTIEIICHGVPSPLLWRKYIKKVEQNQKSKITKVNFRAKKEGWKLFGLEEKFINGTSEFSNLNNNFYLEVFLNNLCLRPSCYNCKTRCEADLILGDLWGSQEIIPEMDDDKGLSLVITNSMKGENLFDFISQNAEYTEIELEEAVKYNPSLYHSVARPEKRSEFFENLNNMEFEQLEKKYKRSFQKSKRKDLLVKLIYYLKQPILSMLRTMKLRK